jgi:3-phenylpropionate/cinnamic acid dioxygenase small subunit
MTAISAASPSAKPTLLARVEYLLYREARLLDLGRFDEWLELFTETATYWVPLVRDQQNPQETSSIIYDDRTLLAIRVRQYAHPRAHARLPASRTCHQVGNVMIEEDAGDQLRVVSTLIVLEYRQERQRQWGAVVEHRLVQQAGILRIASKRIDLINSEAELEGISILF